MSMDICVRMNPHQIVRWVYLSVWDGCPPSSLAPFVPKASSLPGGQSLAEGAGFGLSSRYTFAEGGDL